MKYTCSTETIQQNGRFTLFSSKFHCNIYSILFASKQQNMCAKENQENKRKEKPRDKFKYWPLNNSSSLVLVLSKLPLSPIFTVSQISPSEKQRTATVEQMSYWGWIS